MTPKNTPALEATGAFFHQQKSRLYQDHFRGDAHEDIIWLYGKMLSLIEVSIIHDGLDALLFRNYAHGHSDSL